MFNNSAKVHNGAPNLKTKLFSLRNLLKGGGSSYSLKQIIIFERPLSIVFKSGTVVHNSALVVGNE